MLVSNFKIDPKLLEYGDFDVWRIQGNPDTTLLSPEELLRFQGLTNPDVLRNFGLSRCAIKLLVRYYTNKNPQNPIVQLLPGGKPVLIDIPDLHFSLSHSGGEVVMAFSRFPVGFDLEKSNRRGDFDLLARRFFTRAEVDEIEQAGDCRRELFLQIWTAKEAMLKLQGSGISGGLEHARIVSETEGCMHGKKVFLYPINWPGCTGRLASFEKIRSVRVRELIVA